MQLHAQFGHLSLEDHTHRSGPHHHQGALDQVADHMDALNEDITLTPMKIGVVITHQELETEDLSAFPRLLASVPAVMLNPVPHPALVVEGQAPDPKPPV
ncbi:hypothetical protein SFRURICE_007161 [Spodoptera frugiperda]|nr:hypothetical protein SFRURICE_007161 [Spodoptera frugiperda]